MQNIRSMFVDLMNKGIKNPAIIICDSAHATTDESLIHYAVEAGGLLLDGFCDGVCFCHFCQRPIDQQPQTIGDLLGAKTRAKCIPN